MKKKKSLRALTFEESTTWFSHSWCKGSFGQFTMLLELIGQRRQDVRICQTEIK